MTPTPYERSLGLDARPVPGRCRRVYDLLKTGRWLRVKDIVFSTGHPCDERKLRELFEPYRDDRGELKPGSPFEERTVCIDGRRFKEFRMPEPKPVVTQAEMFK